VNLSEDSRESLDPSQPETVPQQPSPGRGVVEVLLILALFFVAHGDLPPDVNEGHYLGKAKHYWNPAWCPEDHFLKSADAHLVFYWTIGWLTKWLSLGSVAWIGRLLTWGLLAVGWFRLTRALIPKAGIGLLTAACYLLLMERAHLAGEWVVGGIEAKGIAYGFLFLAIEAVVRNRWRVAWVLLGLATAFHVLVGGWATVATGFAWLLAPPGRESLKRMVPLMILGGCLALSGLLPALLLTSGAAAGDVAAANNIYVYQRLPHHLLVTEFSTQRLFCHLTLLLSWLALLKLDKQPWDGPYRRLTNLVMGAMLISAAGLLITLLLPHPSAAAASLLRFYWYRLADALLPLGLIFTVVRVMQQWSVAVPRLATYAVSLLIAGASCYLAVDYLQRRTDPRPAADRQSLPRARAGMEKTRQIYQDWVNVCRWIRRETPADAIFVTPRRQQTFKWYAQRAEVVCWKDVPQDAPGLVQWYQRTQDLFAGQVIPTGFASMNRQQLLALRKKYQARYIVRPRFSSVARLPLKRIYPLPNQRSYYEVYELSP
jgi:hypothetical protein